MALPTVTISGTSSDDVLLGTFGDDVIYGGAGTTIAVGSDGVDEMSGGFGNDTYIVNDTADVIIENPGEGIDTVYTSQNYTLPSDVENIISFANKGVVLTGNSGNNILDGSQTATNYADQLWGMEGNDIYYLSPKDKVVLPHFTWNCGEP